MKTQIFKAITVVALAIGLLTGSASAKAESGFLVINTLALHFKNFEDRNAFTPGLGWEYSPTSKIGWHAGTLSDSFGFQSTYAGINYATKPRIFGKVRFLIGATVLHKQFRVNAEPETKIVPFPAMEVKLSQRSVLNISGSPQVDFANQKNNAVVFFQYKLRIR